MNEVTIFPGTRCFAGAATVLTSTSSAAAHTRTFRTDSCVSNVDLKLLIAAVHLCAVLTGCSPELKMSGPSSQPPIKTIALTAIVATAVTSAAILSYQSLRRDVRKEQLKKAVGEDVEAWEKEHSDENSSGNQSPSESWADEYRPLARRASSFKPGEYDDSLVREQLSRNYSFLGEDSMTKIRDSYVVVVGCGGVGSWAATMLLRSGVGKLLLIDFDMTTLSSLNRHACATLEDVGTPKAIAMQKYFRKIAPWARVDVKVGLWKKGEESERWLDGADYVVDAIDNIDTKVDLLTYCHKNDIKVFASMGAGAKQDPTRVQIA